MKIAITGATGQLGTALMNWFGRDAYALTRPDFDLYDSSSIAANLINLSPDVLINAAAYTSVDQAEADSNRCIQANALAVDLISDICREIDCVLVQISTDYVFHGRSDRTSGFREMDPPTPKSIYAKSKLSGEQFAARCPRHFIVRTCGLYSLPQGPLQVGRNFPETMLTVARQRAELTVVEDQVCTPTSVDDLVPALACLLETDAYGLYHITNTGQTNWLELARRIFQLADLPVSVRGTTTQQYNAAAPRPPFSVLNTDKYRTLGGPPLPSWEDAIQRYIERVAALTNC